MNKNKYIKSPLNYTGGKFKLLSQITPLFPDTISTFVDLFGGGFNVGVNVKAEKIIYNDKCFQVKNILEMFYNTPIEILIHDIEKTIEQYQLTKENAFGYLTLRTDYNESQTKHPILLYTLICYAFNNQIRFNLKDEFNMPFGKNKSSFNPTLKQKFTDFVNEIHTKNIEYTSKDFSEFKFDYLDKNSFVYCDPPYFNTVATYNENCGWHERDELSLRNLLIELNKQGIKWGLSNNLKSNTTLEQWAKQNNFNIHYMNYSYKNCNYQKKDKNHDIEVLITNY